MVISLPKTVVFNFTVFPISIAVKLPVLVDYRTKFNELHRGTVVLSQRAKFGMVKLGWGSGSAGIECNRYNYWGVRKGSIIKFKGSAHFAKGVSIRGDKNGQIFFGDGFAANQNFFCASNTIISFGDNVVLGWNVHVRDGDGHDILNERGEIINRNKSITIGNRVWIASFASILKGTSIEEDSIVGYGSIVTKSFVERGVIIGGTPATIIKRNISWLK